MTRIKRKNERKRLRLPATIYRGDRSAIGGCIIQDISESGARLKMTVADGSTAPEIPKVFIISFTSRGEVLSDFQGVSRNCELVWERGDEVGVKFLSKDSVVTN